MVTKHLEKNPKFTVSNKLGRTTPQQSNRIITHKTGWTNKKLPACFLFGIRQIWDGYFDTIKIQETTLPVIINKGKYDFSTETKSGLFLQSSIDFQGDNKNKIVIIVTKNGIVKLK